MINTTQKPTQIIFISPKKNVETINNELDDSNLSENRKKKVELQKKKKENCFECWRFHVKWH